MLELIAILIVGAVAYFFLTQNSSPSSSSPSSSSASSSSSSSSKVSSKSSSSTSSKKKKKTQPALNLPSAESHPFYFTKLNGYKKGKAINGLKFSPNGSFIATLSDRHGRIIEVSSLKKKQTKFIDFDLNFDDGKLLNFFPDSRSMLCVLDNKKSLSSYKLEKVQDKSDASKKKTKVLHVTDYEPHPSPFKDLIHCSTSLISSYITSISDDGYVAFWAPAEQSPEITFSFKVPLPNNEECISSASNANFFAIAAGQEIKVFELSIDKSSRSVTSAKKVMVLTGHTSSIKAIALSTDGKRATSIDSQGTLRIFSLDVRYKDGEDPRLIYSASIDTNECSDPFLIALAPDAVHIALGSKTSLCIYQFNSVSSTLMLIQNGRIPYPHASSPISRIEWHPDCELLATIPSDSSFGRVWNIAVST